MPHPDVIPGPGGSKNGYDDDGGDVDIDDGDDYDEDVL
jgi:hypothetical protein